MDFLGLYNLFMALAVAGACSGVYDATCDSDDATPPAYVDDGGAARLPPAWTVINRPPTMADNGYNPNFYWNRPDNEYADENGYYPGYEGYGYYGAGPNPNPGYAADNYAGEGYAEAGYPGYAASYPTYSAAAMTDDGYNGVYGEYQGGYGAPGGYAYGYGYYQHPVPYGRERREHRAAMARPAPHEMPAPTYSHTDVDHDTGPTDRHGGGYNGHDRHMFEGHPAKQASADYGGRDNGYHSHQ